MAIIEKDGADDRLYQGDRLRERLDRAGSSAEVCRTSAQDGVREMKIVDGE